MKTYKLFFECEKCGQPFDLSINKEDFKQIIDEHKESDKKYIYELKREFYCCGQIIEINIRIIANNLNKYEIHQINHRGLRNFRTDENFAFLVKEVMNEICFN